MIYYRISANGDHLDCLGRMCCTSLLSHVQPLQPSQALLSMGFSRQEYWSGLPFPSPGDLPDPGIEPRSPALQVDSLPSEPPGRPQVLALLSHKSRDAWEILWTEEPGVLQSMGLQRVCTTLQLSTYTWWEHLSSTLLASFKYTTQCY